MTVDKFSDSEWLRKGQYVYLESSLCLSIWYRPTRDLKYNVSTDHSEHDVSKMNLRLEGKNPSYFYMYINLNRVCIYTTDSLLRKLETFSHFPSDGLLLNPCINEKKRFCVTSGQLVIFLNRETKAKFDILPLAWVLIRVPTQTFLARSQAN